jgi:hypothetical protein
MMRPRTHQNIQPFVSTLHKGEGLCVLNCLVVISDTSCHMRTFLYDVTCLMKAEMAEPVERAVDGEWLGKHASAITDTRTSQ